MATSVVLTREDIQKTYPDKVISDLSDNGVLNLLMQEGYYSSWLNFDVLPSGSFELSKDDEPLNPNSVHACELIYEAAATVGRRAAERDQDSERSMLNCVKSFNVMFGKDLTEEQGWAFMVLLKMSRSSKGKKKHDDYIDMSAYSGLMGEAALKEQG